MPLSATRPLVSVVVPVFNGAPYLAECLDSVISQDHENWECVVVDNASADGTPSIAAAYAARDERIRVVTNPETLPIIPNFNVAMRQISPESVYTKLLCADDWLLPECLWRQAEVAERHPNVGIVGGYAQWGDRVWLDGLPFPGEAVPGRVPCRLGFLRNINVFGPPSTVLFRSTVVRERWPAFFDEAVLHADADVCYDVLRDHDFGFVHQVLVYVRIHDDSMTDTLCAPLFTWKTAKLARKKKYGRSYLSEAEYQSCMKETWRGYYDFLAREMFSLRRDREFWRYHRTALESMGEHISLLGLGAAVARRLLRNLLNPGTTLARWVRRRQRGKGAGLRARSDRIDLETGSQVRNG